MGRAERVETDINFRRLYFMEAGSQSLVLSTRTMLAQNLIPSDLWCQREVLTEYRPLPILAGLDESTCLNSHNNYLASPARGDLTGEWWLVF